MNTCTQCRKIIVGEFSRIDAGTSIDKWRLPGDVNLHQGACEARWWLAHFPHLCKVVERAA